MVLLCVGTEPLHHPVCLIQRGGEAPLGSKPVVEIYKGKAPASHIHAVAAVYFLIAIDIAAAVYTDDGRQGFLGILRTVNIQQIPSVIGAVGNIPVFFDALRQGNGGIPTTVVAGSGQLEHRGKERHKYTSRYGIRSPVHYTISGGEIVNILKKSVKSSAVKPFGQQGQSTVQLGAIPVAGLVFSNPDTFQSKVCGNGGRFLHGTAG